MSNDRIPLIYDTDLGEDIDDLYALYLALFHPRLDLRAVTTAHMDTQLKARLAAKVLRMAGRPDIPVGAGVGISQARVALGQTRPNPDTTQGFARFVTEDDPEWNQEFPSAIEVISRVLGESEEPVALVGEGAFSNLADAVLLPDAALRENIRSLAIMGGETQAFHREYNVICDPEAAEVILNCGLPIFMGTYFLTARLVMTMDDVAREFSGAGPVYRVLRECTDFWAPGRGHKPGPVLYDLVPVFWLADETCVKTRRSTVHVELHGTHTRGQTVRTGDDGPVIESLELDADGMVREFIAIMHETAARLAG